ncbi:MAG TPA: DVUA0089 family protein, partial [Pyrinomonadaceae bacterium]|nr:DVUA0089 family protein [Pyrinomonadaceae bacterium]
MLRQITLFGALALLVAIGFGFVTQNSSAEKRSLAASVKDDTAGRQSLSRARKVSVPEMLTPSLQAPGSDGELDGRQGCAHVDVELGKFTKAEIEAMESICADPEKSTQTPPDLSRGIHEANILTIVLDIRWTTDAAASTSDIFGNTTARWDPSLFGFTNTPANRTLIENAILAEVQEDYFNELAGTVAGPPGQDLRIDFILGDIGVAPPGLTNYYYMQLGDGTAGPHIGALGVAGGSVVRNSGGTGPNFGIVVGNVVGSIFIDNIQGLGGLAPANALSSGDITFTTFAVAGTTSHEAGHALSLSHINKAGSTQPTAVPPLMGTGAIDLPNQDRIGERSFSLSGVDGENGNAARQHIPQLLGAIGLHSTAACTLTCPANITVSNAANQAGAVVNYPAPTTTGNCGTITASPASGSFFPIGITPVTATSTAGPMCSFNITVNDTQPPNISTVANSRFAGSPVSNSTIANVSDNVGVTSVTVNGGASATVSGVTVSNLVNTAGVVTASIVAACGATNANFNITASDAALNTATAQMTVTVTNPPPVLTYTNPPAIVYGQSGVIVNPATGPSDNGSVASVAVQSTGTYTGNISVTPAGVVSISNAEPVGAHTITIRVTDNCGATTDAPFTLIVNKADTATRIISDVPDPTVFGQPYTVSAAVTPLIPTSLSGTLGVGDPTYNRPLGFLQGSACSLSGVGTAVRYRTHSFTLASSSNITLSTSPVDGATITPAAADTFITLYGPGGFNPATPCANAIAADDDTGGSSNKSRISTTTPLAAGNYTLVVTSFDNVPSGGGAFPWTYTARLVPAPVPPLADEDLRLVDKGDFALPEGVVPQYSGRVLSPDAPMVVQAPSGNISVSDGTNLCVIILPAASCVMPSTSVGAATLTATYSGNANFNGSTAPTVPHTVNKADSATTVQTLINAPNYGSTLTATATITAVAPGSGTPQGTVNFNDGAAPIAGCQNVAVTALGAAVCTTNQLPAGVGKVIQA